MKKFLIFLTIIIATLFFVPVINAKPTGYYKKLTGECREYPNIPGFCIQSGVDYNRTKEYYACDAGLSCYEAAAAYYGYIVETDDYWQAQRILNGRIYYSNSSCTSEFGTEDAANYANNYCKTPNFGNSTLNLKVGETLTFTDTNNSISNYKMTYSSSAFTVTKTSNGISITALSEVEGAEILFYKGSVSAIVGKCSNESQNYVTAIAAPYMSSKITINISNATVVSTPKYGIFRIQKVNEDNEPLENVKFKIGTNLGGNENTDWKYYYTNSSGLIIVSDIPVGTSYYYQEVETLENYILNETINYIYIEGESTYTRKIINQSVDTGMIKIIKKNQYNVRLANVNFNIGANLSGVKGTDWDTYTTNQNGEIVISGLPINTTVYAQEINTVADHIFDPDTIYRLVVNEEQLYDEITIINTLNVNRTLKIIKRTTETNKLLEGVRINIYKSDGTIYTEEVTDKNGEINLSIIEDGSYYLEEVEAPEGHVKLNGSVEFTISEDNPNVTLELFNDLENVKTGDTNIVIPFLAVTLASAVVYFILKFKQKVI